MKKKDLREAKLNLKGEYERKLEKRKKKHWGQKSKAFEGGCLPFCRKKGGRPQIT